MKKQDVSKISEVPLKLNKLKEFFAEYLDGNEKKDKYGLSWAGKVKAKKEALIPTSKTLNPQKDESKNWDETGNVFIEGDNLEALKLLQKKYFEKIKMIYIDPPYNTGKDFIYRDNFHRDLKVELEESGEMRDGAILSTNVKTNGRFHSDWLNMMFSRLFLAHKLLRDDGVIFVSIDDNEVANLRLLMDEIFGEENFVGQFIWNKKNVVQNDATFVSVNHEYVICYAKNCEELIFNLTPRTEEQLARYKNPDNDPRGDWTSVALQAKSGSTSYKIVFPNGVNWSPVEGTYPRLSKESLMKAYEENRLWFGSNGNNVPRLKKYLSEVQDGVISNTLLMSNEVGSTQGAKESLKKLLKSNIFDTPKPIALIKKFIILSTSKENDIILDFFAGSGTTAHAVMDLNAEDGGNRKYICVQLDEDVDKKTEAGKAGFKNIAEISRERIRRAGDKIAKGDIGFRSFKVSNSNYREWQVGDFDMFEEKLLEQAELFAEKPLIDNYENLNVVFELIVKEGFSLSASVSVENNFYEIVDGYRKMFVDFGETVDVEKVKELGLNENDVFVCFDSALNDSDKVNLERGDFRVLVI